MSPSRPASGCNVRNCTRLSVEQSGLCAEHKRARDALQDKQRGTSTARGYDRQWRKIRVKVLAESPLCRMCAAHDDVVIATDVDHIDGNVHNMSMDNLQPLCHECHSHKTIEENKGFGKGMGA